MTYPGKHLASEDKVFLAAFTEQDEECYEFALELPTERLMVMAADYWE